MSTRLRLEYWDPNKLADNPANWRQHPPAQAEGLDAVLDEVGWAGAALYNERTGRLIDGHLRKKRAIERGEQVPVIVGTWTEEQEALILATLDPLAGMAVVAGRELKALLESVEPNAPEGTEEIFERLRAEAEEALAQLDADVGPPDPGPQIDRAAELQEQWGVEHGDVWEIGKHRLVCGDCTDAAAVEAAMDGEKYKLCVTSPPFTDQREYKIGKFDWLALACGFFDIAVLFAAANADIAVNLGLSHKDGQVDRYWDAWLDHCENKVPLYGWYVWDKGCGMPGEWNGRLAPAHEWVFHFSYSHNANKWVETTGEGSWGIKSYRQKDGSLSIGAYSPDKVGQKYKIPDSVIRESKAVTANRVEAAHPAVFSERFAQALIKTWSVQSDLVYEPFVGSGTTGVACERLGRRARMIEISPAYCSVVLQRLADMGLEPRLVEGVR